MNKILYSEMFVTIIVMRMLMVAYAVQQQENNVSPDSVISSRNNLVNSLSGKELKVAFAHFGVWRASTRIFRNESGHVTGYGGSYYEQLHWISILLSFSLDMQLSKDNAFGVKLDNGSWTGMRGQLQRKEVDVACTVFSGVLGYEIMDLAIYIGGNGFGILIRYPNPNTSNYGHIMIFSPNVWIGWLITIIVCIGCMKLLLLLTNKYSNDNPRLLTSLSDVSMYVMAGLSNHGWQLEFGTRRVIGMMMITWCFASFCFVNIYCSCLASYLSIIFQRPDINTFQDLANNPNYQMTTFKGATAEIIFLESKSGTMKEIGDKLRRCPNGVCVLDGKIDRAVQKVIDENNFVAVLPDVYIPDYIFKTISNKQCRLTMGQETMAIRHYFMGVQKGSPFAVELNQASLWWHALGLQDYWVKQFKKAPQCMLKYNSQGESVQMVDKARLKLKQFHVPFIVLFIGYVLAFFQFLRERFIHN